MDDKIEKAKKRFEELKSFCRSYSEARRLARNTLNLSDKKFKEWLEKKKG